jgi:hypothetical protein
MRCQTLFGQFRVVTESPFGDRLVEALEAERRAKEGALRLACFLGGIGLDVELSITLLGRTTFEDAFALDLSEFGSEFSGQRRVGLGASPIEDAGVLRLAPRGATPRRFVRTGEDE